LLKKQPTTIKLRAQTHIRSDAVARLARKTMDDDCEAMFIACTQLPTYEILDELRQEFGRPVLSAIWATIRQAMRRVQEISPAPKSGRIAQ